MTGRPAISGPSKDEAWPGLPLAEWSDTCATLHMWTQMVGKLRLALSPHLNHWWEVPLYVSARGLATSPIPCRLGILEVEFDFIDHVLRIITSRGETRTIQLAPRSVADFYREFMATLASLQVAAKIWPMPVEIPDPIRFDEDTQHGSYDPEYANRFWRLLVTVDTICKEFRARFIGKASPVHFFWGSFDLAASRFSGRRAPERPGGVLARGNQRGLVAGRRRVYSAHVLCLRRPGASRISRGHRASGPSLLPRAIGRVPAFLRRRAKFSRSEGRADGFPSEHI